MKEIIAAIDALKEAVLATFAKTVEKDKVEKEWSSDQALAISADSITHDHTFQEAIEALLQGYYIKRKAWRIYGVLRNGRVDFGHKYSDYRFSYDDVASNDWDICTCGFWDTLPEERRKRLNHKTPEERRASGELFAATGIGDNEERKG